MISTRFKKGVTSIQGRDTTPHTCPRAIQQVSKYHLNLEYVQMKEMIALGTETNNEESERASESGEREGVGACDSDNERESEEGMCRFNNAMTFTPLKRFMQLLHIKSDKYANRHVPFTVKAIETLQNPSLVKTWSTRSF